MSAMNNARSSLPRSRNDIRNWYPCNIARKERRKERSNEKTLFDEAIDVATSRPDSSQRSLRQFPPLVKSLLLPPRLRLGGATRRNTRQDLPAVTGRGKMPVGCGLHVGGAVGDEGAGVGAAESES